MQSLRLEAKTKFEQAHTIAIFWHRNIDGDCLGSALSVGTLLTNQGKQVSYFTPDTPVTNWHFLEKISLFQTQFDYTQSYDLLLFVDSGNNTTQLKDFWVAYPDYFTRHTNKLVIDHHQSNPGYGDCNIIDTSASSACELITEMLLELYPDQITPEIATYLYMGMSTDTGHFFYEKDPLRTSTLTARLLAYGARKQRLVQHLYQSNSLAQVQFLGHLIDRITLQGKIISSRFTQHELVEWWVDGQHIEHIIPVLTSIDHAGIFVLFKANDQDPLEPHLRCSLRTKNPDIDLATLAESFHGGGHRAAAGARIPLAGRTVEATIQAVLDEINHRLS